MPTTTLFTNYTTKNVGVSAVPVITPDATAGAQTTLTGMSLANVTNLAVTASVFITRSGVDYYVVKDARVPPGGSLTVAGWDQKIVLQAGDVVKAVSSAGASIDVMAAALVVNGSAGTGGGVIINPTLTPSQTTGVQPSSAITFTTSNITPNGTYYWTTAGTMGASSFSDGLVSGTVTVTGGVGTISRTLTSAAYGLSFQLELRSGSTAGPIVVTSAAVAAAPAPSLSPSVTSGVVPGTAITFTVANVVPTSGTYYWTTTGTALSTWFTDGAVSGSVGVTGGTGSFTRTLTNAGYGQNFQLVLRTTSISGPVIATAPSVYAAAPPTLTVNYLVVAGGGAGGTDSTGNGAGGGGGAGGVLMGSFTSASTGTMSVTVGTGGVATSSSTLRGGSGNNSQLVTLLGATILAYGGGGGDGANATLNGGAGGSGGGGGQPGGGAAGTTNLGGAGTAGQGNAGGNGGNGGVSGDGQVRSGGGGGAGGVGFSGRRANGSAGGGPGVVWINGSYYGGGGGAGDDAGNGYTLGGIGGGARGNNTTAKAPNGTANTGGGGGGNGADGGTSLGGDGGSGVVILRSPSAYTITIGSGLTGNTVDNGTTQDTTLTAGSGVVTVSLSGTPAIPGTRPTISTAAASAVTFTTGAEVTNIEDIEFSLDGTKMYLLNRTTSVLLQYTLGTAWNVSTAVYASKSFSLTTQLGTGRQASFIFKTDGSALYAIDITGKVIYQYTLSIAWDISTASYASKSFNVATATSFPVGLAASTDGLSFYTCDPISDKVDRYLLSTAWDISTATLTGRTSYVTTANSGAPQGVTFYNSTSMYVTDQGNSVYQYTLSTPWDVTTAVFVGSKSGWLNGDTAFSSDGTKAFPIGGSNVITQWNTTLA